MGQSRSKFEARIAAASNLRHQDFKVKRNNLDVCRVDRSSCWFALRSCPSREKMVASAKNSRDGDGIENSTSSGCHACVVQDRADFAVRLAFAMERPYKT